MDKQLAVSFDETTSAFNPSNNTETQNSFFDQYECNQAADELLKRLVLEEDKEQEQVDLTETLLKKYPLGLQLNLTPNLLELVESVINECKPKQETIHSQQQPMSEKLKASNFSVSYINIGKWERTSINEGDLVAKCYFAKKMLVWEFLENGLKSKIEIVWPDIIGLRACIRENEPGTLQIELKNPPTFHVETDPQPRKHTIWKLTSDFTSGEASRCRRHFLKFPPGSLDKHYEKLLQNDPRLLVLTQKPFPTIHSPYFNQNIYGVSDLPFSHDGHGFHPASNANLAFQYNYPKMPPSFVSPHVASCQRAMQAPFMEITSPVSVMAVPNPLDEYHHASNQIYDDQSIPVFNGVGTSSNYAVEPLQVLYPSFPMHPNYDSQQYLGPRSTEGLDYILNSQSVMSNSNPSVQQIARVSLTGVLNQAYNADDNFYSYDCDQEHELRGMSYPQSINNSIPCVLTQNTVRYALPSTSYQGFHGEDSCFAEMAASDATIQTFGHLNATTNPWEFHRSL